jgi:predicted nucleotidyltransferase
VDSGRLDALARRHGIELILQFGSTVTGRTHPASDVDLAVLLERVPEDLQTYGELIADLQALGPGREVDVALINRADPLFLKRILGECRLLYGTVSRLQRLRLYAFKRYQDHRRFLALEREYVRRAISAGR